MATEKAVALAAIEQHAELFEFRITAIRGGVSVAQMAGAA